MIQFSKDCKTYEGVCFEDASLFVEEVNSIFSEHLFEDAKVVGQLQLDKNCVAIMCDDEIQTKSEIEEKFEVAVVQECKYLEPACFVQTLYIFHNDWLLWCNEDKRLLVVDEVKIKDFAKKIELAVED